MKNKITPTGRERLLREEDFIVSKTDTLGRISYCNRKFMRISGYAEQELLGKPHNLIRHPEMPRALFGLLWESLKQGREFFGYVKNLCKDGGFYWVFANFTPTYDSMGELLGYYSVRRRPQPQALEIVKPLYREMLEVERRAGARGAIQASKTLLHETLLERRTDYEHFILEI